jgi:ABC-2 type transport system permease protein
VYVFEGMRTIVTGGTMSLMSLAVGGVLAVVYILGASFVFTRIYRKAVRTGLIARYSAESIT